MIDVLLVDDHAGMRSSLTALIDSQDDMEVVGCAADGVSGVDLAATLRPHVAVMDLAMPGLDGVEATRQIVAAGLGVQVLVLTISTDLRRVAEALDAGAVDYLAKESDPAALLDAVRAAAQLGRYYERRYA